MKLVRLDVDWCWKDKFHLYKQTPNVDGIWEDMQFTLDEVDKCDYLLVFNKPSKNIRVRCPVGNKWLISAEPPLKEYQEFTRFYSYFDKVIIQNFDFNQHPDIIQSHGALPWFLNKDYQYLKQLQPGEKTRNLSIISSNTDRFIGHQKRLSFIEFLKSTPLELSYYGRGGNYLEDKYDGLYPYKYSIAIENSSYTNYWTEKLADCFLSWTMPIYYGANNIYEYFPEESLVVIDIEKPKEAIQIIEKAISDKKWEKNHRAIKHARNLILDKYQLFPFIANMINNQPIDNQKTKTHYIPAFKPELSKHITLKHKLFSMIKKVKQTIDA